MKKFLILGLTLFGFLGMLAIAAVMYIGLQGPETSVVNGNQMNTRHLGIIHELNLLPEGDTIRYFYSDAMVDIRKGMYFVTESNLVLHSSDWDPASHILPFSDIESVEAELSDSWIEDSFFHVTLKNGDEWGFPMSAEHKRDRAVLKYIREKIGTETP